MLYNTHLHLTSSPNKGTLCNVTRASSFPVFLFYSLASDAPLLSHSTFPPWLEDQIGNEWDGTGRDGMGWDGMGWVSGW